VQGLSIIDVEPSDSTARYLFIGDGQWQKLLSFRFLPWLPLLIANVLRARNRDGCSEQSVRTDLFVSPRLVRGCRAG
jgi:hypothetical protein